MRATPLFENVRETSWQRFTLIVAIECSVQIVFPIVTGQEPVLEILRTLTNATRGFVMGTLVVGSASVSIMCFSLFAIGRLRPSDVGWDVRAIWPALLVTVACWMVMQGILAVIAATGDGQLAWHEAWRRAVQYPGVVIGPVVGRLPGNVVGEETFYRGFLLAQFYLKAATRYNHRVAVVIAVLGSTVLFSLSHIPIDLLHKGYDGSELLNGQFDRLKAGILFAALYLVTGNLFVCVGMHLLFNEPTPLMQVPEGAPRDVCTALMLILLVAWPLAGRFWPGRQTSIVKDNEPQATA